MKANALFPSKILSRSKSSTNHSLIKPARQLSLTKGLPFQNKNGRTHYTPEYSCFPKTTGELVGVQQFVLNTRKRMSVVSQGYSSSGMAPVADVLVYLQDLNKVCIDINNENQPIIIIEAGATILQVEKLLATTRFKLPLNISVGTTSFVNKSASSLYECMRTSSNISDLIEWVEKIDVKGRVNRFDVGADRNEVIREVYQPISRSGITYRVALKLKTK